MLRVFPKGTRPEQIADAVSVLVRELDPAISWQVSIEAFKPKRTDQQNAFLWGVVYPSILEGGGEALRGWTKQDLHEYFLIETFGSEIIEGFGRKRHKPTTQSDGTALAYGDLWIDTTDLENYPLINRWQSVDGEDKWVLIDNSNQTGSNGVLFADARWSTDQNTINPANDPIPTIVSLLTSNNLDLDAPENSLYPVGMLLFNTRRSGYNVKQWRNNYFNATSFPDESLPTIRSTWVSASGLQSNGSPYMGRKAQRAMVVQAMRAVIDTNTAIRDEDNFFNLMAAPNYPELQPNMVVLNSDRGETGYILGDTPMRLPESATAIQAWATNAAGATSTGEDGCVTRNTYLGLFYPSGIALDLEGNEVAVPASHMMLRTFLRNDTVAYPWLAAAGTRRGIIDNALNIGYLGSATGEFVVTKTRIGIRDVLYVNFINPLVFFLVS